MDREVSLSVELKAGIGYQLSDVPCSAHTVCYEVHAYQLFSTCLEQ